MKPTAAQAPAPAPAPAPATELGARSAKSSRHAEQDRAAPQSATEFGCTDLGEAIGAGVRACGRLDESGDRTR